MLSGRRPESRFLASFVRKRGPGKKLYDITNDEPDPQETALRLSKSCLEQPAYAPVNVHVVPMT